MKDGFLKAAALSPSLRVADCNYNASQIVSQLQDAAARGVKLAVFPEFCLTRLHLRRSVLAAHAAAGRAGRPADRAGRQPGAGCRGPRGPAAAGAGQAVQLRRRPLRRASAGSCPQDLPAQLRRVLRKAPVHPGQHRGGKCDGLRTGGAFRYIPALPLRQMPSFVLGVEICEDLWSALPPSTFHALAGATVIANLSASDETVGKAEYRRALVSNQSARLLCGYLYASAGHGESNPGHGLRRPRPHRPRTAPSSPRRLPSRAAGLRRSWTASGWSRSGRATPASSPAPRGI